MKFETATIADVESALSAYKRAAAANPKREGLDAKKLAAVANGLMPKSDVSKLLSQAYSIGEGKWAKNVLNGNVDGCTNENKNEKIMDHITSTTAYKKLVADPETKVEAEEWILTRFMMATEGHAA